MLPRNCCRDNTIMIVLVIVAAILLTVFSEHTFAGDGLGWDGRIYGTIITRLDDVQNGSLSINSDVYFRIVPALAIRSIMQTMAIPLTVPNTIVAFQILNILMLIITAWLWGKISDVAGLNPQGKWFGFIGLFCNYAILKYSFYYPVLLDTSALAFATLLAWLYITHRTYWLLGAGGAAFFIGPNVGLLAFLLFLPPSDRANNSPPLLSRSAAVIFSILAVIAAWLALASALPHAIPAVATSLAVLGCGVYCLTRVSGISRDALRGPGFLVRLGIVVALVVLLSVLPYLLQELIFYNWIYLFFNYVRTVLLNSAARPGEFLVAHTLYFGPIFLISTCLFYPVCSASRRLGLGWILVLAFGLLQSLNPLSRQMISILPFLVLPTCLALADRPLPRAFLGGMFFFSVAFSKVWQSINAGADFSRSMESQPEIWARYLGSTGNWMFTADYQIQGLVVLVLFVILVEFFAMTRLAKGNCKRWHVQNLIEKL